MSRRRFGFSYGLGKRGWAGAAALVVAGSLAVAQEPAAADDPALPESPATVAAPLSFAEQLKREIRDAVIKAQGSICRIQGSDEHGTLRGTGFLVDADGTLITSYSVGGRSEDLVVTIGEEKYPATRRVADARSGIAILRVEAGEPLPFLECGRSSELGLGAPVISLGFPLDLPLSPSMGLVAGSELQFQNRFFAARHLRVNVVVQRGQGGSPILDFDGKVVGVLISTVENGSGAFALPIEAAQKVLHDLEQHGRVRQGWLGADVRRTEASEYGSSARVRNVRSDGPGYRGGLRAGDVLLQVGERKISSPEDVLDASFYITAEEPLKLQVARAGKKQELTIVPADPPHGQGPTVERNRPAFLGANGMGLETGR